LHETEVDSFVRRHRNFMSLLRLDPVVQDLARYPKFANDRQNALASRDALDRIRYERRRKLTALHDFRSRNRR
jgi:hypothetical protein